MASALAKMQYGEIWNVREDSAARPSGVCSHSFKKRIHTPISSDFAASTERSVPLPATRRATPQSRKTALHLDWLVSPGPKTSKSSLILPASCAATKTSPKERSSTCVSNDAYWSNASNFTGGNKFKSFVLTSSRSSSWFKRIPFRFPRISAVWQASRRPFVLELRPCNKALHCATTSASVTTHDPRCSKSLRTDADTAPSKTAKVTAAMAGQVVCPNIYKSGGGGGSGAGHGTGGGEGGADGGGRANNFQNGKFIEIQNPSRTSAHRDSRAHI